MNKILLYGLFVLFIGIGFTVFTSEISSGLISCYELANDNIRLETVEQEPVEWKKVDLCRAEATHVRAYKICIDKYITNTTNLNETMFNAKLKIGSAISSIMKPTLKDYAYFRDGHNKACAPMSVIEF